MNAWCVLTLATCIVAIGNAVPAVLTPAMMNQEQPSESSKAFKEPIQKPATPVQTTMDTQHQVSKAQSTETKKSLSMSQMSSSTTAPASTKDPQIVTTAISAIPASSSVQAQSSKSDLPTQQIVSPPSAIMSDAKPAMQTMPSVPATDSITPSSAAQAHQTSSSSTGTQPPISAVVIQPSSPSTTKTSETQSTVTVPAPQATAPSSSESIESQNGTPEIQPSSTSSIPMVESDPAAPVPVKQQLPPAVAALPEGGTQLSQQNNGGDKQTSSEQTAATATAAAAACSPATVKPKTLFDRSVDLMYSLDKDTGSTSAARECSQQFGSDMIDHWKSTSVDVCTGFKKSHVKCYNRVKYEVPRMLCVATDSGVRLYPPYHKANSSDLGVATKVEIIDSFFEVDCSPDMYKWVPESQWVTSSSNFMKNMHTLDNLECKSYVNHTVFWVERWDATNMFHFTEDMITLYESLVVLGEDPDNVEMVVYDGYIANNSLFEAWNMIFAKGVRVARASYHAPNTCFRKSIVNMHSGLSLMSANHRVGIDTDCSSPILQSLRFFMLSRMGLDKAPLSASDPMKIVFLSRKPIPGQSISRIIPNEADLTNAIRSRLPANWVLELFSPETVPHFIDHVKTVSQAAVLVGVHGAGLANVLYMPKYGQLVEVFHSDRGSENRHYHNMCKWLGLGYHEGKHYDSDVPVDELWPLIENAIKQATAVRSQIMA